MTYQEKLLDPRWQKRRLEILQQDNWKCAFCGDDKNTLHVHHFVYSKSGNPWDVEDGDACALCKTCHHIYHSKTIPKQIKYILGYFQFFDFPTTQKLNGIIMDMDSKNKWDK